MSLTHVSLFSGVGGFDLAASEAGIPTLAACEIDKAARGVLADRFPNVHIYLDVKEVTGDSLRNLGADPRRTVLTAGWPCQGNSVAGRRGGMADERSGLWHEVARVLAEFRPAWFVGENVPGLLTVNSGRDMETVLDDLNNLGYLVDWNIYDAQYFGVPQRRRRVVFTCQLVDASLQARTPTSALNLAICLTEISLLSLVVLSAGYASASPPWDSPARCADGLRKRIKLYGMERPLDDLCAIWLPNLLATSARSAAEPAYSDFLRGVQSGNSPEAGTSSPDSQMAVTSLSTESSWRELLDDLLPIVRSCTTSTPSRPTTSQEIYTCARALLNISAYTAALSASFQTSWPTESSTSTAIKGLTDYAREFSSDLFAELNGLHRLADLLGPAEHLQRVVGHLGDDGRAPAQVLLEPEGGGRNPAQSITPRPVFARRPGSGTRGGRVAPTLTAREGKGPDSDATTTLIVSATGTTTHALTAEGADASEDGTGRGTPIVAMAFPGQAAGDVYLNLTDQSPTLGTTQIHSVIYTAEQTTALDTMQGGPDDNTAQGGHLVAFALRGRDDGALPEIHGDGHTVGALRAADGGSSRDYVAFHENQRGELTVSDVAHTLKTGGGKPGQGYPAAMIGTTVRRLTPLECERLQGYPDGWTLTSNGKPQSDAARYKQLGNSIAVPVFAWVAKRLAAVASSCHGTGAAA